MKILFTADWHIKLGQKNVPRDWQKNRFHKMYKQIINICLTKNVELLIIGGDIFDSRPSVEEIELFFDFLIGFPENIKLILYDGNHEATKRGKTFLHSFKSIIETIHPKAYVVTEIETHYGIDFIPYTHLKVDWPNLYSRLVCTHVRGAIPPHVTPEIDLDKFLPWDLVLAGDLHSYSNSQRNIIYPGSPLSTNFHRNKPITGIIYCDTSANTLYCEFIKLDVPQLIKKSITSDKDIQNDTEDHIIYEIEGSLEELSDITNTKVNKKLVLSENTSNELKNTNSLEEEVKAYIKHRLDITSDTKIKRVLSRLEQLKGWNKYASTK